MSNQYKDVIPELLDMIDQGVISTYHEVIPNYVIYQYNKTIIRATYLITGNSSSSSKELSEALAEKVYHTIQLLEGAQNDLSKEENGAALLEHWPPLLILERFLDKLPAQGTVAWVPAHIYSTMTLLSLLLFKKSLAGIETCLHDEDHIEAYRQTQVATSYIHTATEAQHKSESILYSARENTLSRIATKDEIEIQIEIDKNREAKSKGGRLSPYKAIHKEINEILQTAIEEEHKYDYIRGEIQEAAVKEKIFISTTRPDNKTLKIWKDKLKQTGNLF